MATQGERLQELLNIFQITQSELAKRLDAPKSSISMYIADKREMRQNRLKQIADMFGVNEAWIMGYDVPMKKDIPTIETDLIITDDERHLIEMYRYLDGHAQQSVTDMIKHLYAYAKKMSELVSKQKDDKE